VTAEEGWRASLAPAAWVAWTYYPNIMTLQKVRPRALYIIHPQYVTVFHSLFYIIYIYTYVFYIYMYVYIKKIFRDPFTILLDLEILRLSWHGVLKLPSSITVFKQIRKLTCRIPAVYSKAMARAITCRHFGNFLQRRHFAFLSKSSLYSLISADSSPSNI
jgi:hypothetical protein